MARAGHAHLISQTIGPYRTLTQVGERMCSGERPAGANPWGSKIQQPADISDAVSLLAGSTLNLRVGSCT